MNVLAVTDTQALWYFNRGTGLVSVILLTIVVALGISQRHGLAGPARQRFVVTQLHRNAALFTVVFLALHIASSVLDGFAPINWLDAVIPFASAYRTLWLGLGTIAFDLIITLVVTSLLRQRIGYPVWRTIHWFAYLAWPVAFIHGLGTGSDGTVGWVQVVNIVCLGVVVCAISWRLARGATHDRLIRTVGAVATVAVVIGISIWTISGPMQAGWARKAGTPASLLGQDQSAEPSDGAASTTTGATGFVPPFSATIAGTAQQTGTTVGAAATITLDGTATGGASGRVVVVINGRVSSGGGVQMQSSTVTMGPDGDPTRYSGSISQLRGTSITATMTGAGTSFTAQIDIQFDSTGARFTGTLDATK